MDFFLGSVAGGRLGDGQRNVGVAGHIEIENCALVGCRRAE
jgi:hypothetical protein